MFRFLIKKNFADIWDNLFHLIVLNLFTVFAGCICCAVVMLADVCEAACKSIEKPTAQRLEKFIQELINAKIESNQLDNSALTFGELTKIRDTFVRILAAYYHGRIKYQNQKDPDSTGDSESKDKSSAEKDKSISSEIKGEKDKSTSSEIKE